MKNKKKTNNAEERGKALKQLIGKSKRKVSKLTKSLSEFDEQDVKAMDEALRKFANYKKAIPSGLPDYSPGFVAYTPILSIALLKSQATLEKLTRWLIVLSCVLGVLAIVQVVLMV